MHLIFELIFFTIVGGDSSVLPESLTNISHVWELL